VNGFWRLVTAAAACRGGGVSIREIGTGAGGAPANGMRISGVASSVRAGTGANSANTCPAADIGEMAPANISSTAASPPSTMCVRHASPTHANRRTKGASRSSSIDSAAYTRGGADTAKGTGTTSARPSCSEYTIATATR
jgi:hypothetical protein